MTKGLGWILFIWLASFLAQQTGHAQADDRTLRQFHHTAWTEADGAPAEIWALDQGPDGFLWLGTGVGLFRFDGTVFERFQPAAGDRLASIDITSIKVLSANEIWIGYSDGGVSRVLDGRVTTWMEKDGFWPGLVFRLLTDDAGVLWAGTHGGVARFVNGEWEKLGKDWGLPDNMTVDLFKARDGTMWLSTADSIFFLRPNGKAFEATGANTYHATFTQTPDGQIWVADALNGLRPLPQYLDGQTESPWRLQAATPGNLLSVGSYAIDGQDVLWGTDRLNGGIFRIDRRTLQQSTQSLLPSNISDVFRRADGLTSDRSLPMLRDREGNIWVGTNAGLDRFRDAAIVRVASVSAATAYGYSVAATADATYISDGTWLYRALPGQSARRFLPLPSPSRMVPFCARDGTLWYGSEQGLYRFENDRFELVPLAVEKAGGAIRAIAEDGEGALWVTFERAGVHRLKDGVWTEMPVFGELPLPMGAHSDPSGAVWFAFSEGKISRHDSAGMRIYSSQDGLNVGNVEAFYFHEGTLWVGGEFGIARLEGERFLSMGGDRVVPLTGISGIGLASNGDMLFNGLMGVVRMDADAAERAAADPSYTPAYKLYDRANGLPGVAQQGTHAPTIVTGADGRTWFVTNTGVATFNPAGEVRNQLPPPVTLLSLSADGKSYPASGLLDLPGGASALAITYTAASLTMPERIRFRYRLEGLDADWVEAGSRREAVYSSLGPGRYRFHVIAANEDGVWNTEGATMTVEVPPTFIQSWPFKLLCALALAALLWLIYSIRMRIVVRGVRQRMAERIEERERIARELHDTLLQSVQTLTLRFQFAAEELPQKATSRAALEEAIDRADEVIAEGRDRVRDLRSVQTHSLEQIISDMVTRQGFAPSVDVTLSTSGTPREIEPLILDEVTRIASEAICNIWKHAKAKRVMIDIVHAATLTLRFTDDGIGLESDIVERGERDGHFGLKGMRERAKKLRGDLLVRNLPAGGSEVVLTVPGWAAYRTGRRGMFAGLGSFN